MARPVPKKTIKGTSTKGSKGKKRRADALDDDDRNDFFLDEDKAGKDEADAEEMDEIEETADEKRLRVSKLTQITLSLPYDLGRVSGSALHLCWTTFLSTNDVFAGKQLLSGMRERAQERGTLWLPVSAAVLRRSSEPIFKSTWSLQVKMKMRMSMLLSLSSCTSRTCR